MDGPLTATAGHPPLTPAEFAVAIRRGRGAALAHVRAHGDAGIEEILKDAIVHARGFDQQSEGRRSGWLMTMLSELPSPDRYHDAMFKALPSATEVNDVDQMAGMLLELAQAGNQTARQALYDKFDRQEFNEDWLLSLEIVELDRLDGLRHVARTLGRRLAVDVEYWIDKTLMSSVRETLGDAEVDASLLQWGAGDADIERFRQAVSAADDPAPPAEPPTDVDTYLSRLLEGKAVSLLRFVNSASAGDFEKALELASQDPDPKRQARVLRVFRWVDAPGGPTSLLPFVGSADVLVRRTAIAGLARFKDKAVADLAAALLDEGSLEGLALLEENAVAGQLDRVSALLQAVEGDDDAIHRLVLDLIRLTQGGGQQEAAPALLWAYQHTPCAFCRTSLVDRLVALGALPADIALECADDCQAETRELVASSSTSQR